MVSYPLAHLTQDERQEVSGPIQDDEAPVRFALIRCMRMRAVVEIGGLAGYSARAMTRSACTPAPTGMDRRCRTGMA